MNRVIVAESEQGCAVSRLLAALDARHSVASLEDVLAGHSLGSALILSESQFVAAWNAARTRGNTLRDMLSAFQGVLIYPFSGSAEGLRALEGFAGARVSTSAMSSNGRSDYVVHGRRDMCGPFSGLRVREVSDRDDLALRVSDATCPVDSIVTGSSGNLLTKFELPGLSLFVTSSRAVFDTSAEHLNNLDVRDTFSGLVPLLFFLRSCHVELPETPLRWANWIIDDPNLTPRYGFLDVRELARCILETRTAASIAFIPWNHRRTAREIVTLFRETWPQLSICIHGCDHTGSEFSTRTMSDALPLVDLAMRRMRQLHEERSLRFEPVMVFPQGRFSAEAMRALRASEMLAAVNTELLDCQTGSGVKGAELLRPAITSFGGFPLFMRRPAEEDPANFALDLLLGKPCLIVTHHQYFEHGLKPLESALARLNALDPEMVWTNLEHGISSTCSVIRTPDRTTVRLYSARTKLLSGIEETLVVTKAETDPDRVEILVDEERVSCSRANGGLQFTMQRTGKESTVEARATVDGIRPEPVQSTKYRLKVTARRYLTEMRDNYLSRFPRLHAGASSVQRLLRRELPS
jgi:hypothetical protein